MFFSWRYQIIKSSNNRKPTVKILISDITDYWYSSSMDSGRVFFTKALDRLLAEDKR